MFWFRYSVRLWGHISSPFNGYMQRLLLWTFVWKSVYGVVPNSSLSGNR